MIHDFDKGLDHTLKAIEKLSTKNSELIKKYDKEMVRNSPLSKVILFYKIREILFQNQSFLQTD